MNLVFVTQVLDRQDAILGFTTRWIAGLAKHCDRVRVLALEVGDSSDLPANVDWRVIGRKGKLTRWLRYRRQLNEALGQDGFDTLLTHMVPRYSNLGAGLARKHGARHFLWYTHKGVDARLRKAVGLVERVFTASPESLRVDTPKKVVTGHGIDVTHFGIADGPTPQPPTLLSAGRLTPAKDPLCVLAALGILRDAGRDVRLVWAGGGLHASDTEFGQHVRAHVSALGLDDQVEFLGDVPYPDFPDRYRDATLFVSASHTGSVDKVVLEAMSCGRPAISCNESFGPIFAEYGDEAANLTFPHGDAEALAQRIAIWLDRTDAERAAFGRRLRATVERDHEVDALMGRLVRDMGAPA